MFFIGEVKGWCDRVIQCIHSGGSVFCAGAYVGYLFQETIPGTGTNQGGFYPEIPYCAHATGANDSGNQQIGRE